jgi:hypothetical protein
MTEFETALQQILLRNEGNRLTQEVMNGLYATILQEHNKIVEKPGEENGDN